MFMLKFDSLPQRPLPNYGYRYGGVKLGEKRMRRSNATYFGPASVTADSITVVPRYFHCKGKWHMVCILNYNIMKEHYDLAIYRA